MPLGRERAFQTELIRGKAFSGGLWPVVLGRADSLPVRSRAALLLEEGAARLETADGGRDITGPALAWISWPEDARIVVAPGSVGSLMVVGVTTLLNAIGHTPEAAELRGFAERDMLLALADRPQLRRRLEAGIGAILDERAGAAAAARTIIESHLRIMLVRLWRAQDVAGHAGNPRSPAEQLFNRFSGLLEEHYRDHWTVQDYARVLGVSRDRLGDICRRIDGRSPKDLCAARLAMEARMLLERSTHSVEQIAGLLGFATSSQFSRFFSRAAGLPPGRFRAELPRRRREAEDAGALHAWP